MTPEASAALAAVLARHPGPDEVIVVCYDDRIRLGVRVDSTARQLPREASVATLGACVQAVDTVAFPPF